MQLNLENLEHLAKIGFVELLDAEPPADEAAARAVETAKVKGLQAMTRAFSMAGEKVRKRKRGRDEYRPSVISANIRKPLGMI